MTGLRAAIHQSRLFPAELAAASNARLPPDLAEVVSESIFDIPRLMEAARHQRLDPLLRGRSAERSDAGIPSSAKLDVRRQAGVDETLGLGDRPFVELCDSGRKRLYERIQISVREGTINVAVGRGLICCNVLRA